MYGATGDVSLLLYSFQRGGGESMVEWMYKGYLAMSDNNFVVYAYVRSKPDRFGREGTFYYIGKGRPGRPYQKSGRTIKRPEDVSFIEVLHKDLDENTAFEYEKKLIEFYGRVDIYPEWGILRNLTNGGEGTSGIVIKEETKIKMSISRTGGGNGMFGRTHKDETKRKISVKALGRKASEDTKRKLSMQRKGENNGFYGKTHSEESKRSMSEKQMGITLSDETKKKISEKVKGELNPNAKSDRDWYHPKYGEFKQTAAVTLVGMFPDENLSCSGFSSLYLGEVNVYKGWVKLENKGKIFRPKNYKGYNWAHPEYGIEVDISPSDLVRKYPEEKLNRRSLASLTSGDRKIHKGWVLIE